MTVLVTGGAGFIGSNVAHRLLERGERVRVFDNLSRPGVEKNAAWLGESHPGRLEIVVGDVRDRGAVREAVRGVDHVFHLAAQVAVTTSVVDPRLDFDVNAVGTLNVLEAVRAEKRPPSILFTSTNKVYGALDDVRLRMGRSRYEPEDDQLRARGISEARALSFHSPYGCSKGAADQYVLDYARIYALPAVVFRMSCIYGPRQFGTEDQGWVAHFLISALRGRPITIYGDGKQVRDVLYVDDLLDAFELAEARIRELKGQAFNIGGGPAFAVSLAEMLQRIAALTGRAPRLERGPPRPGDQLWYVSDIHKFAAATGWRPKVQPADGLERLLRWLETGASDVSAPSMQSHEVRADQPKLEL